jgi:hypothetical protein
MNSEHVILRPIFCPCRSVLRSMMAHVRVWTASVGHKLFSMEDLTVCVRFSNKILQIIKNYFMESESKMFWLFVTRKLSDLHRTNICVANST